jgi:glycosyltransferase involved in cell wall biosynthesis
VRILIVSQYFWPENFKINDLAVDLQRKGHEVTVLTGIPNYPGGRFFKGYSFFSPKKEVYNNVNIIRSILFPRFQGTGFWLFLNFFSFACFSSITALFRLKKQYDLILVWEISPITVGIPAILLKKIWGIPIVFWVLDLWPESVFAASNLRSSFFEKRINTLVKSIYRNCDRILVSSEGFIDSVVGKGVNPEIIDYVPNWADEEFLLPLPDNRKDIDSLIPDNAFTIMFAGNIGESQDFESILKAVELLKDNKELKWLILGDGRKKEWLKQQIREKHLGNSISLLGKFPPEFMPYFFSKADAMLVALKDKYIFSLTVPAKVQTYMAAGKPIISMMDGETPRIVNDAKAGLTCNAGDYDGLSKNVLTMSRMSLDAIKSMSENSLNYYRKHFDKGQIITRLEEIFISTSKSK